MNARIFISFHCLGHFSQGHDLSIYGVNFIPNALLVHIIILGTSCCDKIIRSNICICSNTGLDVILNPLNEFVEVIIGSRGQCVGY